DYAESLFLRILVRGDNFFGFFDFWRRGSERLMNDGNLRGMNASHAFEAHGPGAQRPSPQAFKISYIAEDRIDRLNASRMGGIDYSRAGIETFRSRWRFGDAEISRVILQPNSDSRDAFAGFRNRESILNSQSRFKNWHQPHRSIDAVLRLDLARAPGHLGNLIGSFHLRNQDQVWGFRHDLVEISESERKLVYANHPFASCKVHSPQGISHEQARCRFFAGMNGIFQIEDDAIRSVQSSINEVFRFASGDVKTRSS